MADLHDTDNNLLRSHYITHYITIANLKKQNFKGGGGGVQDQMFDINIYKSCLLSLIKLSID